MSRNSKSSCNSLCCFARALLPFRAVDSSVFAEMELLRCVPAEGVPEQALMALRAEIVTELFTARFDKFNLVRVVLQFLQKLTYRFHVVIVQIRLRNLGGIVRREHLHLDHIAVVVPWAKFLATEITRDV